MVADTRAASETGQPEVEETGFAQAREYAHAMNDQRKRNHPRRTEDQKQLGCDRGVGDEPGVGDAREHLRARQRHKYGVTFEPVQRSAAKRRGRLDAGNDAGGAEQDETAESDGRAVAPMMRPVSIIRPTAATAITATTVAAVPSRVPCNH